MQELHSAFASCTSRLSICAAVFIGGLIPGADDGVC